MIRPRTFLWIKFIFWNDWGHSLSLYFNKPQFILLVSFLYFLALTFKWNSIYTCISSSFHYPVCECHSSLKKYVWTSVLLTFCAFWYGLKRWTCYARLLFQSQQLWPSREGTNLIPQMEDPDWWWGRLCYVKKGIHIYEHFWPKVWVKCNTRSTQTITVTGTSGMVWSLHYLGWLDSPINTETVGNVIVKLAQLKHKAKNDIKM